MNNNIAEVGRVSFPEPRDIWINMMPFAIGEKESVPSEYVHYWPLIEACGIERELNGKVGYLTVSESLVKRGQAQRRTGIHTEGHPSAKWGNWGLRGGLNGGLYMASTNGACRAWDTLMSVTGEGGDCSDREAELATVPLIAMKPDTLYWLHDRTPHETLPSVRDEYRQWVRVVSGEVGIWYSRHSTPNRLGVQPACRIVIEDKFITGPTG